MEKVDMQTYLYFVKKDVGGICTVSDGAKKGGQ